MDEDTKNMYLQNIEDYVYDENKTITYKWLSKNLSLHINSCKMLMTDFLRNKKKNYPNEMFSTTYYVYGLSKEKSIVSAVVSENELAAFKQNIDSIISEHIYSIRKGVSSTELNALHMIESADNACIGIIKNDEICALNKDDLEKYRRNAYPQVEGTNRAEPQKKNIENKEKPKSAATSKLFFKKETPLANDSKEVAKKSPTKTSPEKKTNKSDPIPKSKKAGIANFFSKQESKPQICKPVTHIKEDLKPEKTITKKDNVLKNDPAKLEKIPEKNEEVEKISPSKKSEVKEAVSKSKSHSNDAVKKNGKLSTKKNNKKSGSKKEPTKKRKRIQCMDSDDSSDGGSDKDDIFAPSSPEPMETEPFSEEDVIPQTPQPAVEKTKTILNSRKRKKVVDRTYMEDGYILTKKEEIFESCSDSDDAAQKENEVKTNKSVAMEEKKTKEKKVEEKSPKETKTENKKSKKKVSPPSQGKQSSLMNFFKKETK